MSVSWVSNGTLHSWVRGNKSLSGDLQPRTQQLYQNMLNLKSKNSNLRIVDFLNVFSFIYLPKIMLQMPPSLSFLFNNKRNRNLERDYTKWRLPGVEENMRY